MLKITFFIRLRKITIIFSLNSSFVHPSKTNYNTNLKPYDFNLEKAKTLLTEAEWRDTDGDGILDKMIDGSLTPLKLSIKYNAGNDII